MKETTSKENIHRTAKSVPLRREYLKLLRKQYKITAPVMAQYVGLSCRQHYLRYENGERDFGNFVKDTYFGFFSVIFELPYEFFAEAERDYLDAKKRMQLAITNSKVTANKISRKR